MNLIFILILCVRYFFAQGHIFHISTFGAYANDNIDDTQAITNALNYKKVNSTIVFGLGIYNLSSTIYIINASNLTILGQGMDKTLLVGNNSLSAFFAVHCNRLKISAISIDFDPLPFTAGYVVHVNETYFDLEVVPPHQTDLNRQIVSLFRYNPQEMRPAYGSQTYQIFQTPPNNISTSVVSPGILRIPMQIGYELMIGDAIVAIYHSIDYAIAIKYSSDVIIQSISLYTSWFMGLYTFQVTRINVTDYHAKPRVGHWLSTNSDCMHFTDAREYIDLSNSKCHLTGDDGLNVHKVYLSVTERINSSALVLTALNWTEGIEINDGTRLEFTSKEQPFTDRQSAIILSSSIVNETNSRLFIFTSSIDVNVGDWAYVADTPSLTVRNLTVENNRAHAALLETRNVDIRYSIFNRTSAPAILFQPSMYFHEGPAGRNITLANNLYINCNEGIVRQKGVITVLPHPAQFIPVIQDIRIESSTFYFRNDSQGFFQGTNAENVYITGNYIATNNSTPLISICNSRNITASNNTVVDVQSKSIEYYTFDQTDPCQMNISSLIDLPPAAFNSSFSPPV